MAESKSSSKSGTKKSKKEVKLKKVKTDDASSSASSVSDQQESEESGGQIGKGVGTASITVDREEYLLALRDLTYDKNQLHMKNNILHRRLAEYYKKRKLDHVLKPLENSMDLEEKYQENLFSYEELKERDEKQAAELKAGVQTVELQYAERLAYAEDKFDGLQTFEKSTGTGLIYSAKGKAISEKTVQRLLTLQRRKQEQSSALCLRYVRARNAVTELEAIVHKLEMIGPGLYVAQFEQLDVDNQNLMTKIEEREDELIKNRAKCTEHNQILAHIREKMHHTEQVIDSAECDLGDAEIEYTDVREELGAAKIRRGKLRWSLEAERLKAGLLTRKDLLRDFQNATDEVVKLREQKTILESQIERTLEQLRKARKRVQRCHNA